MKKSMGPRPETLSATLMSEGSWKWTRHIYVETLPVVLPQPDGAAWEFMYRCAVTGVTRRWGTAHRSETCEIDEQYNAGGN